jgi:hypothetical protein
MSLFRSGVLFTSAENAAYYDSLAPPRPPRRLTKLTITQEQELIKEIFDLDRRGLPLSVADVEFVANSKRIFTENQSHNASAGKNREVGRKWTKCLVDRIPELKACLERNQAYHQDTVTEQEHILRWFKLVQEIKAEYNISDKNIFSQGEARFFINPLSKAMAVSTTQHQERRNTRGQKNYRLATVFQTISASGKRMPPTVIFPPIDNGNDNWFNPTRYPDNTSDWIIANRLDGCNDIGLHRNFLDVFDRHTMPGKAETWRLLILNRWPAGPAAELDIEYKSSNIITVCIPPGLAHLLQPLEQGCVTRLSSVYQEHNRKLRQERTTSMTDDKFVEILRKTLKSALDRQTVATSFKSSGLVPFAPSAVLPQTVSLEGISSWEAPRASSPHPQDFGPMIFCGSEFRAIKARITAQEDKKRRQKKLRRMRKVRDVIYGRENREPSTSEKGPSDEQPTAQEGAVQSTQRARQRCGSCGEAGHNVLSCMVKFYGSMYDTDSSMETL